jgi:hypothetical protein
MSLLWEGRGALLDPLLVYSRSTLIGTRSPRVVQQMGTSFVRSVFCDTMTMLIPHAYLVQRGEILGYSCKPGFPTTDLRVGACGGDVG